MPKHSAFLKAPRAHGDRLDHMLTPIDTDSSGDVCAPVQTDSAVRPAFFAQREDAASGTESRA
jgi:hypothetical protein